MRAFLITALLASVSVPAVAAPGDHDRASRSEARSERSDRAERGERAERPQREEPSDRGERADRAERRSERAIAVQDIDRPVANDRARAVASEQSRLNRDSTDTVRNWRGADIRRGGSSAAPQGGNWREIRENERRRITDADVVQQPTVGDRRVRRISRVPVEGSEPPVVATRRDGDSHRRWDGSDSHRRWSGSDSHRRWRDSWRHDRRYDWSDWRRRHGSLFRLGFYFDPFGWNYRRYDVGYRLWPQYYSSRYWLNDPWQYRLPYAPAGYRWVRYWDDAILVDTWSGEVVDVIRNFFW